MDTDNKGHSAFLGFHPSGDVLGEPPVGHRLGLAFHCGSSAGVDQAHAAILAA